MFITHWRPVILLMQKLMSRFVFPLNYQKTESQSSSQNAKVPITKSLEDFMIDRLPNQSPVHDLQVHVLYVLLIKIVCTHWFFMVDENDISPSCCRLFTCTNYRPGCTKLVHVNCWQISVIEFHFVWPCYDDDKSPALCNSQTSFRGILSRPMPAILFYETVKKSSYYFK